MMRLAEIPPTFCSSCFQQDTSARHVDFDVAWDGPVMDGAKAIQIDDLFLCERCLKNAAKLIGLVNAPNLVAERDGLQAQVASLVEAADRDSKTISDLQRANESAIERREGRPGKIVADTKRRLEQIERERQNTPA